MKLLAGIVTGALLLVACGGGGAGRSAQAPAESRGVSRGGSRLPDIEFEMSDGSRTRLADFETPLVINFFASWCAPCRAEMPDFQEVYEQVRGRVTFLGLDLQDEKSAGAALVEETGVRFPWGLDPDGEIYAALGGFSMPTTVYVAEGGRIVGRDNGPITAGVLRERIERLLGVGVP